MSGGSCHPPTSNVFAILLALMLLQFRIAARVATYCDLLYVVTAFADDCVVCDVEVAETGWWVVVGFGD